MRGAWSLALLPLVAGLGYWLGPEAAGALVLVLALGGILLFLSQRTGGQAAPVPANAPAAGPVGAALHLAGPVSIALGVHVVAALIFNLTGFDAMVAPDTVGYRRFGEYIAQAWSNPAMDLSAVPGYKSASFYQHLNAALAYVLGGDVSLTVSVINGAVATWAAYNLAKLAALIYGPAAGRRTFLLAAFFPSILLWTSINLRDAWSFLALSGVLLAGQRLRDRLDARSLLVFLACLAFVPFIRSYLLALLIVAIALSYVFLRVRQLPYALLSVAVVIAMAVVVAPRFGMGFDADVESRLELMNRMKQGLSRGASAYDTGVDISTPGGALAYLPRGIAVFLFAPFPWSINSWRQMMSVGETLIWYVLFVQGVLEISRSLRTKLNQLALPLSVALVLTVAYGLVEGNQGTAFRHRSHVMLVFFVFVGGYAASRQRTGAALPAPVTAETGTAPS